MPDIPCAHDACPHFAILSVKTSTGWANLCRSHYLSRLNAEAREYCRVHNLTTRDTQVAFMGEMLKNFGKAKLERIPGEDDDGAS